MTQQELAQAYSNLCALYGDLMLRKEQIEKDIKEIKNKISNLQQQTKGSNNEQFTDQTKNS